MLRTLLLDSHPVQYRAPLYREIARRLGRSADGFLVLYASNSSLRGAADVGFGQSVAWDEPLLDGYEHRFLPGADVQAPSGFRSLAGNGLKKVFREFRPDTVLLNGIGYAFYVEGIRLARKQKARIWLRSETQDHAFPRKAWKSAIRHLLYRYAYSHFDTFFAIGKLNAEHYRRHGVAPERMAFARYCVQDRFAMSAAELQRIRAAKREEIGLSSSDNALLFSGKLIEKKNPRVILQALQRLPEEMRSRHVVVFMGSGELESLLRKEAEAAGIRSIFLGFINQSLIADYYLACDALILPSRQMGETWGLVANEALMAGRPVILSRHAGSSADFGTFEGVQVIDPGPEPLAAAIAALPAIYDPASIRAQLADYTIEAAARNIVEAILARTPSR